VRAVLHADLYRLDHLTEVADLAIGELVEEGAVAVVEWGDVGAPVLGEALVITLASPPGTEEGADAPSEERAVAVSAGGSWTARAAELAARLGDWSCP
jgi:tRNA A37 threonylcarbamoyladenosine biosynthesis protein TsaE